MIRTFSSRMFLAGVVSSSLMAAACSDDPEFDATFSTADEAHLVRAVDVMQGRDFSSLLVIGLFIAGVNEPSSCPSITTAQNVTTVNGGGCTTDEGTRLDGRIVITNMEGLFGSNPDFDPTKDSSVEAIGWSAVAGAMSARADGKLTLTNVDGNAANGQSLVAELDLTADGITSHSERSITCDAASMCTEAAGNWIDVDGVGAATLSGSYRHDDVPAGSVVAKGAETLTLDIAASTDNCRAIKIDDGSPRQLCQREDGETVLEVTGQIDPPFGRDRAPGRAASGQVASPFVRGDALALALTEQLESPFQRGGAQRSIASQLLSPFVRR